MRDNGAPWYQFPSGWGARTSAEKWRGPAWPCTVAATSFLSSCEGAGGLQHKRIPYYAPSSACPDDMDRIGSDRIGTDRIGSDQMGSAEIWIGPDRIVDTGSHGSAQIDVS